MNIKIDSRLHPSPEFPYFVSDPNGDTEYFRTEAERDAVAESVIQSYLQDGWDIGVDQITAGMVTHRTVMIDKTERPKRDDFKSDEDYQDAIDEYGDLSFDYTCNYVLRPLSESGAES